MALTNVKDLAIPIADCCRDLGQDVTNYLVEGHGGILIGKIDDLITDTDAKVSRYMIVDTTVASFTVDQKRILVPICGCDVDHNNRRVHTPLTRAKVVHAPEYDPNETLTRDREDELHSFFQMQAYWALEDSDWGFGIF